VQNGHIFISGVKSDITIVFLNPNFLKRHENLGYLHTFKADTGLLIFAWIFRTRWPKIESLGAMLTVDPNKLVFIF